MKKLIKIIIGILILVIVIAAVIYRIPQKIEREMTVCALSGETKTVKMELYIQRYFLRPNELKGNIFVDGVEFYSLYGYKDADGNWDRIVDRDVTADLTTLFNDIKEKFILGYDYSDYGIFYATDYNQSLPTNFETLDQIHLVSNGKTFEEISVWLYIPEEYPDFIGYHGPAETAEDAEAIAKEIN